MGLDMSHDAWSGPYSLFNEYREAIAQAADIPLPMMEGFTKSKLFRYEDRQGILREWPPIPWEALKYDHLHVLLRRLRPASPTMGCTASRAAAWAATRAAARAAEQASRAAWAEAAAAQAIDIARDVGIDVDAIAASVEGKA